MMMLMLAMIRSQIDEDDAADDYEGDGVVAQSDTHLVHEFMSLFN